MRHQQRKHAGALLVIIAGFFGLWAVWWFLAARPIPTNISYGVSFSKYHADELGLPWQETYDAIINDLGVRHLRLSAHWPMIEPARDTFHFDELDYQMDEAEKAGVSVILAIGKRLPGWPECHVPSWARGLSKQEFERELFTYMKAVVERYKHRGSLILWQVENEPFLTSFAKEHCGELDKRLLETEIAFVKELDPFHKVLLTDSGEFGRWLPAYKRADTFGSTLYIYVWGKHVGPFRWPIGPSFFRVKRNIAELVYGKKPALLVELSAEPWLLQPIKDAPVALQLERMGLDKLKKTVAFGEKTGFDTVYLWGAEWWYYLKKVHGLEDHWDEGKGLVADSLPGK